VTEEKYFEEYYKKHGYLDSNVIDSRFEKDERALLEKYVNLYPNHIIRMPNFDLISKGFLTGIGGYIPSEWNGLIYQI
jgi:hypothetical protein